ncbi:hypothetical protein ACFLRI_00900 [Bacteroidota bacterium]
MRRLILVILSVLFAINFGFAQEEVVEEVVSKELKAAPEGVTAESVIKKYVEAIGGEKKMLKVKSITTYAHTTIQGADLMFTFHYKDPGKYFMEMGTVDMTLQKQVCDGTKAKIVAMGNEKEVTGAELEALKYEASINKELRYAELGVKLELLGIDNINGVEAYALKMTIPGGAEQFEYFDINSGLRIRTMTFIEMPEGKFENILDMGDYKPVKGVKFPFSMTQSVGGQVIELTVSSYLLNKVDDAVFVMK